MRKCKICDERFYARDLCKKHYDSIRKTGVFKKETLADRMKKHSKFNGRCLEWIGSRCLKGYGRVFVNGRQVQAHRASWELANGKVIPHGLHVLHRCDNPRCINPDHLFLGTDSDNKKDMRQKGRQAVGERCKHAKLTSEAVREIRKDKREQKLIAIDYEVDQSLISKVKRNRIWRHVS